MKKKFKLAAFAIPFFFLISCSDSNDVQESNDVKEFNDVQESNDVQENQITWDATNYTMYNEFMQCTAGEDYSQEALDDMIES